MTHLVRYSIFRRFEGQWFLQAIALASTDVGRAANEV
jgi:hypothetical protein